MPKFYGKEEIYVGFRNPCSSHSWSAGTRRIGNHHLPQEAEGEEVVEDRRSCTIPMLRVIDTTRGCIVGDRIELADTSLKRMFGLLGRRGLDAGEGLWIKPSSGVHTFFMAFTIDVVGLDSDLRVIKLWRCLAPWRVTSVSFKMRSVLELPSGTISRSRMEVGDRMEICDSSEAGAAATGEVA
jgi:uncharacterized protein